MSLRRTIGLPKDTACGVTPRPVILVDIFVGEENFVRAAAREIVEDLAEEATATAVHEFFKKRGETSGRLIRSGGALPPIRPPFPRMP